MSIVYLGIDLAKTVFAVHGVNEFGRAEIVRWQHDQSGTHLLPQNTRLGI